MSRLFSKIALPALSLLALGACQNYFVKPNIMPTGYTYLNDEYKTIPSPEAVNIGYDFDQDKNNEVLRSLRSKVTEMITQLENSNDMMRSMRVLYLVNADDPDPQSAAFEHVLRDELRARDYILTLDWQEGLVLEYVIKEPEQTEKFVNFGDMNKDHRDRPHYKRLNDYEPMIVEMGLYEGTELLDTFSAAYTLPMYGYERDYSFKDVIPKPRPHSKTNP